MATAGEEPPTPTPAERDASAGPRTGKRGSSIIDQVGGGCQVSETPPYLSRDQSNVHNAATVAPIAAWAAAVQISVRRRKNRLPDSSIATGKVSTQAMTRLRTVPQSSPDPFAAIVPATPLVSTWVVETGR